MRPVCLGLRELAEKPGGHISLGQLSQREKSSEDFSLSFILSFVPSFTVKVRHCLPTRRARGTRDTCEQCGSCPSFQSTKRRDVKQITTHFNTNKYQQVNEDMNMQISSHPTFILIKIHLCWRLPVRVVRQERHRMQTVLW